MSFRNVVNLPKLLPELRSLLKEFLELAEVHMSSYWSRFRDLVLAAGVVALISVSPATRVIVATAYSYWLWRGGSVMAIAQLWLSGLLYVLIATVLTVMPSPATLVVAGGILMWWFLAGV